MSIPFFQQAAFAQLTPLAIVGKRISVNQMAVFVLDDAGLKDSNNVEQRIWAPSRPVIHLAAAGAIVGQEARKSGYRLGLESLLLDRSLIERIVTLAAQLETMVAADTRIPIKAEQLIRFRLN